MPRAETAATISQRRFSAVQFRAAYVAASLSRGRASVFDIAKEHSSIVDAANAALTMQLSAEVVLIRFEGVESAERWMEAGSGGAAMITDGMLD